MSPEDDERDWSDPIARVLGEMGRLDEQRPRDARVREVKVVREPESVVRIPAGDCDPSGQLGGGRCLDLLVHVRQVHALETYGIDAVALARRTGTTWAVQAHELLLVEPVRAFDEVRVRTRLVAYDDTSHTVESWVLDRAGRRLKVLARSRYVFRVRETGRPERQRDEDLVQFEQVLAEGGTADLAARAVTVQAELRRGAP